VNAPLRAAAFLAGAFAYGYAKSALLGAKSPGSFPAYENTAGVLEEELIYRTALERWVGRDLLGLSPTVARLGQAAAFGLVDHPWNPFESALGAVGYSYAYDEGGLPLSVGTHLLQNLGVYFGGLK
jgi:hypothetical protein